MIKACKMRKITESNKKNEINRIMNIIEQNMKKRKFPELRISFHDLQIFNEKTAELIEKELIAYGYEVERQNTYFDISWQNI